MGNDWTKKDIMNLDGKTAVVTGGNSGIGYEAALGLAEKGAEVVLAVRNMDKGRAAVDRIKAAAPEAHVKVMKIDLSDLSSIHEFAKQYLSNYPSLDMLINNAGIMMPPLSKTKDGFEAQFGNNHLGHFALTGLLLERLKETPGARVVTVSSLAAHKASIYFNNLDGSKGYGPYRFYGQSKLANMVFGKELDTQFRKNGVDAKSIVCHPGITHTNLASRNSGKPLNKFIAFLSKQFTQPTAMGALPTLYAATEPTLKGGEYIGPDGNKARKGYPKQDSIIEQLVDERTASRLWAVSEEMTGVKYMFE